MGRPGPGVDDPATPREFYEKVRRARGQRPAHDLLGHVNPDTFSKVTASVRRTGTRPKGIYAIVLHEKQPLSYVTTLVGALRHRRGRT